MLWKHNDLSVGGEGSIPSQQKRVVIHDKMLHGLPVENELQFIIQSNHKQKLGSLQRTYSMVLHKALWPERRHKGGG